MAYRGLGDTEKAMAQLAQQGTVGVRVSDPLVDGLQELIRGERVHLARGKLALESRRFVEANDEFQAKQSGPTATAFRRTSIWE